MWLLCAFDLGTLAFYMMDRDHKGYLNRGEVRLAVAQIYSVHNTGPRLIDGTKPLDSKLTRDEHVGCKWQREHFQGRIRRF